MSLPADKALSDVPPNVRGNGVWIDGHGCEYRQMFDVVPALEPLYLDVEKNFNGIPWVTFAERYEWIAWTMIAAYVIMIFPVRWALDKFKVGPFKLRGPLIYWNLLLSVFSLIGFVRTAPHLLHMLFTQSYYYSVCSPAEAKYGHGAVGLWVSLFVYSKGPELIDTFFIVMRKSPLIFLHWYHHITVLLFCWYAFSSRSSSGLYFAAMNYGVHALMYFYYFLRARGHMQLKWDRLVTTLQISQMVVGMFVCLSTWYYKYNAPLGCDVADSNLKAGLAMYASYFALFVDFAVKRYITKKPAGRPAPRAGAAPALPPVEPGVRYFNVPGAAATTTAVAGAGAEATPDVRRRASSKTTPATGGSARARSGSRK